MGIFKNHFNELYQLYLIIYEITFDKNYSFVQTYEFYDMSFPLHQMSYYFFNKKDFKKCKKMSKRHIKNFPNTDMFEFRVIMCEYELNRKNKGFKLFKSYIKDKKYINSYISHIKELMKHDKRILPYLENTLKEGEYLELIKYIEKDKNSIAKEKIIFMKMIEKLKEHFNK